MAATRQLERNIYNLTARLEALKSARKASVLSDPVEWAEGLSTVRYQLDEWQRDFLRSNTKREILLCSRQVGKSATSALKAAHIVRNGGLCLAIAPTQRQASLLFRQIQDHISADGVETIRNTQTEIEIANGGHAICLGADRPSGIRGHSMNHPGDAVLLLDEAAFTRNDIWPVISPFLASAPRARMVLLSTPCGPVGEFHRIWMEGGDEWNRVRVPASDCPRISPDFLKHEKSRLGDDLYSQEYECQFVQPAGAYFSSDLVAAMFDEPNMDEAIGDMFAAE